MIIQIDDELRVTYRNEKTKESWKWKKWKDCTYKEKQKVNLRELRKDEIVLDDDENLGEVILKSLDETGYKKRIVIESNRGNHVHLFFDNLSNLDEDVRKEIRKIIIRKFNCDISKASEKGVISIEGKTHFKSGKVFDIIEKKEGLNHLNKEIIKQAENKVKKDKELAEIIQRDINFNNYTRKDLLFRYITKNKINEGMRNLVLFKNIAVALVKQGLGDEVIKNLMKPIIDNNFSGKNIDEFIGWVKKVRRGEIDNYNIYELNNWAKTFLEKEFYKIPEYTSKSQVEDNGKEGINSFISLNDLLKKNFSEPSYWLKPLVPKGTINIWGGKPSSAKSLLALAVALHLVANKDFLEFKVKSIPKILFYDLENGEVLFYRRCKYIINGNELIIKDAKFDVSFKFNRNDLNEEIERCRDYDIIILDSYRRFLRGDESDSTISDKFYQNFLHKLRNLGKTVIIIHHFRKIKLEDLSEGEVLDAFRGSSDIGANIDNAFGFFKTSSIHSIGDKENFIVKVVKAKVRDTYPLQDFSIEVERDGSDLKTKFNFEGWGKHKEIEKPKDRAKRLIREFLKIEKKERKDIVDMMKKEMDYAPSNVDILLKELVNEGKIETLRHGVYSANYNQSLKIDDLKTIDENK